MNQVKPRGWIKEFNQLIVENKYPHLHQLCGWKDIDRLDVWSDYVADTVNGLVKRGDKVFEAGCGALGFLNMLRFQIKDLELHGMDAGIDCITKVKQELALKEERDNFQVGCIPHDLQHINRAQFDVVLSNSVFQYLSDLKTAYQTIQALLRLAKPKGIVILADICDITHKTQNESKMKQLWKYYGQNTHPRFLYFEKNWFKQFAKQNLKVVIRNVDVASYYRREERFVVYLIKS